MCSPGGPPGGSCSSHASIFQQLFGYLISVSATLFTAGEYNASYPTIIGRKSLRQFKMQMERGSHIWLLTYII
jgi:hypothetical protein